MDHQRNGIGRYFEVLWENLGKLLLMNLLCFAAFLPLAMGISLGIYLENFWLAALGGFLGGGIFAPVWIASLGTTMSCFLGFPMSWFPLWRSYLRQRRRQAALEGAVCGTLAGILLFVGQFSLTLVGNSLLPAPIVWVSLGLDFLLLALLAVALALPLAVSSASIRVRLSRLIGSLSRVAPASLAALLWAMLGVALFPVSIPFAAVIGFWPLLLLLSQLYLPLADLHALESMASSSAPQTVRSILKRKVSIPLLVFFVTLSMVLGVVLWANSYREPDLQVAVVHAEPLPDSVRTALEGSIASLIGDQNGDGFAEVTVNDYSLTFDGSTKNADIQTAAMTRLITDLNARDSSIFLVEDAESFLASFADLMNTTIAAPWASFPILTSLDAGTYSTAFDIQTIHTGQSLLSGLVVIPSQSCPEEIIWILTNSN